MNRLIGHDCVKEEGENARSRGKCSTLKIIGLNRTSLNTYEEGCLVDTEHFADVTRPADVDLCGGSMPTGMSEQRPHVSLWSTCVQHEIDQFGRQGLFIDTSSRCDVR